MDSQEDLGSLESPFSPQQRAKQGMGQAQLSNIRVCRSWRETSGEKSQSRVCRSCRSGEKSQSRKHLNYALKEEWELARQRKRESKGRKRNQQFRNSGMLGVRQAVERYGACGPCSSQRVKKMMC